MSDTSNARLQKIECELGEQEYNEIMAHTRALFLWSMPAAETSIRGPGKDRYSGLYQIPLTFLQPGPPTLGYDGSLTTKGNQIRVRESAVVWTATKMSENCKNPMVKRIRAEPWGNTGRGNPEPRTKEGTMGAMGHPNQGATGAALGVATSILGYDVGSENGDWDLKPGLESVWGANHRYGNENWVLYYDVLSNVHYGYVGAAAGMPLHKLVEIAGIDPTIPYTDYGFPGISNSEDPKDYLPTKIGHDLFATYPNGISSQSLWAELKRYRAVRTQEQNWSIKKISI
ncbi:hypothetical protein IP76_11335 [Rhizobium sp. AAP43]|nr:hypothetical protein IP76_11335 [Rhizobium sp. AAP43]